MFNKAFLLDLAERSIWTFLQVAGALFITSSATDLSFTENLKISATAGAIAVVKCLISSRVGNSNTAQGLPGIESTYVNETK